MLFRYYPDCCALDLAYDFYSVIDVDIAKLIGRTKDGTRVVCALNNHQLKVVKQIQSYIKKRKLNCKFKLMKKFENPKSKNMVFMYLLENEESIRKAAEL